MRKINLFVEYIMSGALLVIAPAVGVAIGSGIGAFSGAVYGFVKSDFDRDIWNNLRQTKNVIIHTGKGVVICGTIGLTGGIVAGAYWFNDIISKESVSVKKNKKYKPLPNI